MRISLEAFAFGALVALVCGCGSRTGRLIAELKDSDPKIRRAAAQALGDAPQQVTEPGVAALVGASKDPDREVREFAIGALGRVGPAAKSSVTALGEALGDEENSVRVSAAFALQKIDPGNEPCRAVILEALAAADGPVFLEVGRMGAGAKWAVPTLIRLLSHQQPGIRALSARTLGRIGVAASEAESALTRRLHDTDPAVRQAAERAIEQIRPKHAAAG